MHVPQVRHTATHSWHGLAGLWQTALLMCVLQTCQSATAETGSADVQALKPISNLLLPPTTSDDVSQTDNWTLPDVCGSDGCGVSACTSYEPYVAPKPCNWGGICCLNWNVVGITLLPRDAMSFSLSTVMDAVSKLDNLTVLRMPQQGFTGTLPTESISNLTNLQILDLSDNQLTGTLPTKGISSMTSLQVLDLSNNQLTGFPPSSWGNLSHTASVDLSDNNLIGRLPVTWIPHQQSLKSSVGMDVHGNPGICNPTPQSNGRTTCSTSMLSEQLAVDPQAGAVSAAPPPPAYASPTPAAASQETSGGIAVLKFIPIAVFLTMIGLSCLLCVMSSTCRSQARGLAQQKAGRSPPRRPHGPPCLVLGPDGRSLAIATAPASPISSSRQGSACFSSSASQRHSTMYTAYLDVEELAPVDGTRSCCTRLEDSVAPPLVDFVAPSPWPGDSVTPSSGDLDAPAVQRSLTSLDSRGNTMNTSTSWVLQAVELEDTAKT